MRHSVQFYFLRLLGSSSIAARTAEQDGFQDEFRSGSERSTIATLAGVGLGLVSSLLPSLLPGAIVQAATPTVTPALTSAITPNATLRLAQAENPANGAETCAPPASGEFLLLVIANSEAERTQALDRVGNDLETTICQYLADTVVRVAGLQDQETATDLARTLTNAAGLSAFITQLPEETPEPEFAPRPYGEALNLPEVQVVEARPAVGNTGVESNGESNGESGDGTSTDTTIEAAAEAENSTDNETNETPEDLPTFSPEDLPPADLTAAAAETTEVTASIEPPPREVVEAKQPTTDQPTTDEAIVARVPFPGTVSETADATVAQASEYSVPPPPGFTPAPDPVDDGKITITGQFSPQPIAAGYVVLVDYFNDPAIAAQVASLTGQAVGLVSYGQRPFLMADFSTSETEANATLEKLTEQGLWVMVVNSSRAVLLTPRVVVD